MPDTLLTRFTLVPHRSRVWARAKSQFFPISGEAANLEGFIDVDLLDDGSVAASPATRARLELPVQELTCGNALYDWELLRLVDARRHPKIVGELVAIEEISRGSRYIAKGYLTIGGMTQPVVCDVDVFEMDGALEADWEQTLDIRDFDIPLTALMKLRTYPEIEIRVHVEAIADDESRVGASTS